MKRLLTALALMASITLTTQAQEVYKIVLEAADKVVADPHASDFNLRVNQFKATTLRYIVTAGLRLNGSIDPAVMDNQAYYMSEFLTQYFTALTKTKNAKDSERKHAIMKYVKASRSCPLYKDPDNEDTEIFVTDPGGYTPFSINTDWEKALAKVNEKED